MKLSKKLILLNLLLFGFVIFSPVTSAFQRPFDYYVLSLSWSPEFCVTKPNDRQCGRGYGLVLHGLWPQYTKGFPHSCSSERISGRLIHNFNGLFPSDSLAIHQWKKHGTCSELSAQQYLELSQTLKSGFITPPLLHNLNQSIRINSTQLSDAILKSNPNLTAQSIQFSCNDGGRFLQEIYICFDKQGTLPVTCGNDLRKRSLKSCGQKDFLVRSVR